MCRQHDLKSHSYWFVLCQVPEIRVKVGSEQSHRHHEATKRQTQERNIQGQEGAQAGHAGSPAAGGHHSPAYTGSTGADHCGLCLCGHQAWCY